MKRRFFLTSMAALGASTLAVARGRNSGKGKNNGIGTASVDEKAKILYIYQEEKVARDVYLHFNEIYPNEYLFGMIALSEQRHMDAAERVCNTYGIDTSNINEEAEGEFVIPELQQMHDTLVLKGENSLLDALEVGREIEIVDINDIEEALEEMPHLKQLQGVYSMLLRGSNNHLNAFESAIRRVS